MAKTNLSKASFVERGYGQVEPNHLSAQRTGQIYAQLPAAAEIDVLENGQFVKYDYANGVVNFEGAGEWMLVYNAVKLYRDNMSDCDFAMLRENYVARVYSPVDGVATYGNARNYEGVVKASEWEPDSTTNPFVVETFNNHKNMPEGTTMVPRVFKTNVGDLFTTNMIMADDSLEVGATLNVNAEGILSAEEGVTSDMKWQVVKIYTLPDRQKAVKVMRIA